MALSTTNVSPNRNLVCCNAASEPSRRERRAAWWSENKPQEEEGGTLLLKDPRLQLPSGRRDKHGQHPLFGLLRDAEMDLNSLQGGDHTTTTAAAAAPSVRVGQRLMCQVIGSSSLGLSVATVPDGTEGLVYADEAGYMPEDGLGAPAVLGDVVPAYVVNIREQDEKVDLSFRPRGTVPKLEASAKVVFEAAQAAGGRLPLGDASEPSAIRRALGISKSQFKAARGKLLKAKLLVHPLAPEETVLVSGVASTGGSARGSPRDASDVPPPLEATSTSVASCTLTLSDLPEGAGRRVSGPAGLMSLLSEFGEVRSLRGLVRNGEASGSVQACMGSAAQARAAVDALSVHRSAPRVVLGEGLGASATSRGRENNGGEHTREVGSGGLAPHPPSRGCSRACFVANLPEDVEEEDLWDLFLECGYIQSVELPVDQESGEALGWGRVFFADERGAEEALRLRGMRLRGRTLRVELAQQQQQQQQQQQPQPRRRGEGGRRKKAGGY
jgi:hypothetical protein